MLTEETIKFRAMKMGIATGDMPDVEFIWSVQRSEGSRVCFGQGIDCRENGCSWRAKCLALDFFAEISLSALAGRPKQEEKVRLRPMSGDRSETAVKLPCFTERVPVQAGTLELVSGGSKGS